MKSIEGEVRILLEKLVDNAEYNEHMGIAREEIDTALSAILKLANLKPLDEKEVKEFLLEYCESRAKNNGWCINLLSKKLVSHFSKPEIKYPERKDINKHTQDCPRDRDCTCLAFNYGYNQAIDDMRKSNGEGGVC